MKRFYSLLFASCLVLALYAGKIVVPAGDNAISVAVGQASAGDTLVLGNGTYKESSHIRPAAGICIMADQGTQPEIVMSGRFEVQNSITLQGLVLTSKGSGEALRMQPGTSPYDVRIIDCTVSGFTSKTVRVYDSSQSAPYVNLLSIEGCLFVLPASARGVEVSTAEKQLNDLYIRNSTFDGRAGAARLLYIKTEEGNTIRTCVVDHCTFYHSTDTRGIYLANINGAKVTNSIYMNREEIAANKGFCLYGDKSSISHSISFNAAVYGSGYSSDNVSNRNPRFIDADNGNFQLYANSPAVGAGTDGSNIGDPRWGVSSESYDASDEPYIPYKQPYSMAPTTSSVKVLWQMSEETAATEATVLYGTDPDNLNLSVTTSDGWNVEGEGYVHVVTLENLHPSTRYFFTVGTGKRRFDKICSTKTAPLPGTGYRIFTISDIHGNSCNNWSNMQDFICELMPDIALMNGDFVSSKGNDRNWNGYYFTPGAQFLAQCPVMSSPGNHETGDPRGYRWSSFYDYFHQFSHGTPEDPVTDPRGESYFHFEYGNADVIIVNLNGDESSPDFMPGSRQYQWADSVLNECKLPWIFVCHHVGMWTTGYHGQWSEEPKQFAPLLEKYAKQGKRIIALSGDDHSFEHLYKDGVHYVRPGCGRNSNYSQQKQLPDFKYSMFYRQISCFSTLDMSPDASEIFLTAYDSVGNVFYNYTFLHDGEEITPSVTFTAPQSNTATEDSVQLIWCTFDPEKDAKVSLYYTDKQDLTGLIPIAENLTTDRFVWQTRDIFPKKTYYVYAAVKSAGNTYLCSMPAPVSLIDDTTPPPAPNRLRGDIENGHYILEWQNPTRLVHLESVLEDFTNGVGGMVVDEEDNAKMDIAVEQNALVASYTLNQAWSTSSADIVFTEPANLSRTPTLSFRLKGNGSSIPLRLVCKNKSGGHEDWWYSETFNLSSKEWKDCVIDLRNLSSFDWYPNSDSKNRLEEVTRICFSISYGEMVSGSFMLDDITVSGEIYPAPDFTESVLVRKDDAFSTGPDDGVTVYKGKDEKVVDNTSDTSKTYYYSVFASDDRGNWSAPAASAQFCTTSVGLDNVSASASSSRKILENMQVVITLPDGTTYSPAGKRMR